MKIFVVDASVGLKWFLPEIHSPAALKLRNPDYRLHVPGLFDVEIGNILWKKFKRGELLVAEADSILEQLANLPITRHPDALLIRSAFSIAHQTERTVYDCLYLALAIRLEGEMITADERLFNRMAESPWRNSIRCLADNFIP
jgi:predicted nucleic acid-binding protein